MVTISINGETKIDNYDESWIIQTIQRSIKEGIIPCVTVSIQSDAVNISLATRSCGGGGGSRRTFNNLEQQIINLWLERGLNGTFSGGNVNAFLKQLRRLL